MSNNLYVTATVPRSGKSAICLGLMEGLVNTVGNVGYFRPIIHTDPDHPKPDNDIELIRSTFKLEQPYEDSYAYTFEKAADLINRGRYAELLEGILAQFSVIDERCDFVLCEGTDYEDVASALEFDINADIAKNLDCPVLLVADGKCGDDCEEIYRATHLSIEALQEKGCNLLSAILNRVSCPCGLEAAKVLQSKFTEDGMLVYIVPEEPLLSNPTMREIAEHLEAKVLFGAEALNRSVQHYSVAAMHIGNFLSRVQNRKGLLILTPGDRVDIILGTLLSLSSKAYQNISGLILTGGLLPHESVMNLIAGLQHTIPILQVETDTFTTASALPEVHARLSAGDTLKISTALNLFEQNVNREELINRITSRRSSRMTPKMFEFRLLQRARAKKRCIVLPEGYEERILRAAQILRQRDVVDLILLGDPDEIEARIAQLGLKLDGIRIINPITSETYEDYVKTYHALRKNKKITREMARDYMADGAYFGTMMVYKGDADGMVSGAVHTTQHTIRPALQFIRTKPGFSIVSSVFFMCLEDRVLVYGDCAVNPNPNAEQLAEIAVASAHTAQTFGVEPRVAMLSYSTGASGKGEDVEKVRKATELAQKRAPDIPIEGPLQYDAAVDPEVARTKLPDSQVAGRATVFIFPDLNTGNNTYKAVQRSAGAVAIGPVMQGLRKPVNDLSRGCTIPDIVNTIAITAIQAQEEPTA